MSADEKPTTAREVRLCRKAYVLGWVEQQTSGINADQSAARRYPLPTVEVPRVLDVIDRYGQVHRFRTANGRLERLSNDGSGWGVPASSIGQFSPAALNVLIDLYDNPTERVEVSE
jgi:hypothetical protein